MKTTMSLQTLCRLFIVTSSQWACDSQHEPNDELDVKISEFRTEFADDSDHGMMTESALSFLKASVRLQLADANENTDSGSTQLQGRYHVDNCRLEEALSSMRDSHALAVEAFDPNLPRLADAVSAFGRLLHTAQDFYAHSNWVESTTTQLFSQNEWLVPYVRPGEKLGHMWVLGGGMPASWFPVRPPGSRVPVIHQDGIAQPAWMSGTYQGNVESSICPSSVSIPHGPHVWPELATYDGYLAKDAPLSRHHDEAVAFAKRQTVEEFCRLTRLVSLRHGGAGLTLLTNSWLQAPAALADVCPSNQSIVAGLIIAAI